MRIAKISTSQEIGSLCCVFPAVMETNVVGLLQGWRNILRDFHGNVAVFDFCSASALTSESSIHFFHVQNF